ncbi:hypothetical protein T552_02943 [Pneumocystis carinii B80]|uniref:Uncharacterized protein n=1 Tax=Pneumocystis carinii (strain B80) TaxID=1408658 RepID=A0A0W4ZDK2_PNEC8|nr:hypothetical protein T552_02943 [Pneumocystis carinii B80]KTW26464.1 hypothetical protein T552_02943 [Pneumocystis carinii B80]
MTSNNSNVFDGLYYSSKDTIDKIKQAYSSPKECVNSYWCLIPMILLILFGIFILLVIYYFIMNIIRSCCCCCFLCKPTRYVKSQPTVLVQPTLVPQYPVWYQEPIDPHRRMDMYYDTSPKYTPKPMPQRSPWKKKRLENKKMHLISNKRNIENYNYDVKDIKDKENSMHFYTNFEVESPTKEENVMADSREYLSELSFNSNYSCYNSNQVSDNDSRSIYYLSNSKSYPDTLDSTENVSYFPGSYHKNRRYSGI